MNRLQMVLSVFAVAVISVTAAHACMITVRASYFHVIDSGMDLCYFYSYNETVPSNVTDFVLSRATFANSDCGNLSLSDNDQMYLKNIIEAFNTEDVFHIEIARQTDEEYRKFKVSVDAINTDACDCVIYRNFTREGQWTVYDKGNDCAIDVACMDVPPQGCFSRLQYDLFVGSSYGFIALLACVLIAVFIITTLRFRKINRNSHRKASSKNIA